MTGPAAEGREGGVGRTTPTMAAGPDGYVRFLTARGAEVVALRALAGTVREALAYGTLHQYGARLHAERAPGARRLEGRGPVYAVPLPDRRTRVVIRHAEHGGMLAPLTGDRFLRPTRAPRELDLAMRLRRAGVPTPEVVAYAVYPFAAVFARSDVATREVPGVDLVEALRTRGEDAEARGPILEATAELLRSLARAGARHPDLNLKNVLVSPSGEGAFQAFVLDVDRIHMRTPDDPSVAAANAARLARSARKWRELHGLDLTEDEIVRLTEQGSAAAPRADG